MKSRPEIPLIFNIDHDGEHIAIKDPQGIYTYNDLFHFSRLVASNLLDGQTDLKEARVAFLVPPGFDYTITLWGIWQAGGIAVPLGIANPGPELEYVIENSESSVIVTLTDFQDRLQDIAQKRNLLLTDISALKSGNCKTLPLIDPERPAMILYTSGTTSRPKGVLITHNNISTQIQTLVKTWGWTEKDFTLNVLPLHHVHGIINVLSCALWSGAACEILQKFDAETVWDKFMDNNYTLFMAVPTIYFKLGNVWESASTEKQNEMTEACKRIRLMVSGSAALPVSIFEKWKKISGHTFLERYGMTEIGMALSNPLKGERRPGFVGRPLPGVSVRLVDESGKEITQEKFPGEIQVKGDSVFKEYWKNPKATRQSFKNGWFLTGDVAIVENGYYRILGRSSVDIIKSGGYKISALEIEDVLLRHPLIKECSVVGIIDNEWGEKVSAAVIIKSGAKLYLDELRQWAKKHIATYKVPQNLTIVEELPKNAMGKIIKPEVKKLF